MERHHVELPFLTVQVERALKVLRLVLTAILTPRQDSRDRDYCSHSLPPTRPHPSSWCRIIPHAVGGATVSRHLHRPITVGTRHVADAMIALPHRHLALAETTIDGTIFKVVTAVIVASHPPAWRYRRRSDSLSRSRGDDSRDRYRDRRR